MPKDKSVGAAVFLTFLFGPLGLFYVSAGVAIIMMGVALVVFFFTIGLGLILVWPATMIMSAVMAGNQHSRYEAWLHRRGEQTAVASVVIAPPAPIASNPPPSVATPPSPALPAAPPPPVTKPDISWLRAGERYLLGCSISGLYYGIWDRQAPGPPAHRYPYTEHGKTEVEARFREMEPHSVEGGPSTPVPVRNTYGF